MANIKVVYTCITGGYDDILSHKYVDSSWDYILFTDDKNLIQQGKIHHWAVKELFFTELDNSKNSRYPKINPHLVLPEYRYSFYVDGNICINTKEVFDRLDTLIQADVKLAIPWHPQRECVYEEAQVVKNKFIDNLEVIDAQVAFLRAEGYPEQYGLHENNLIFRQHMDAQLIQAQEIWWQMLVRFSRRDQLSGVYSFWRTGVVIVPLFDVVGYHAKCKELTIHTKATHNRYLANSKSIFPQWFIRTLAFLCPVTKYKDKIIHKLESFRILVK